MLEKRIREAKRFWKEHGFDNVEPEHLHTSSAEFTLWGPKDRYIDYSDDEDVIVRRNKDTGNYYRTFDVLQAGRIEDDSTDD